MKLTDLRPCDNCGGKIVPSFFVVRFSQALINKHAVNQTLAMHQYFEGKSLELAEIFSPNNEYFVIMGDEDKSLWHEIRLCQNCFLLRELNLPRVREAKNAKSKT